MQHCGTKMEMITEVEYRKQQDSAANFKRAALAYVKRVYTVENADRLWAKCIHTLNKRMAAGDIVSWGLTTDVTFLILSITFSDGRQFDTGETIRDGNIIMALVDLAMNVAEIFVNQ